MHLSNTSCSKWIQIDLSKIFLPFRP